MAQHIMALTHFREESRHKKATTIQRHWRGYQGRHVGRRVLHAGRRKMRADYRLRKADDILRSERSYWCLDQVGLAPPLNSDTVEERVLKHFPRFRRASIAAKIYKNIEFAPGQVKDKKKVPKRGFNFGTEEELLEQAWYGGTRLPGYYTVVQGERMVKSSTDLTKVLDLKSRVRIHELHFSIDPKKGIKEDRLYLTRLWRRPNADKVIMYRMQDLSLVGNVLHQLWLACATGPPTQRLIDVLAEAEQRVVNLLNRLVSVAKTKGMHSLGDFFRHRADVHRERRKQTLLLLNEYQARYSREDTDNEPQEEVMTATNLEELKKKMIEDSYVKKEEIIWEDAGRDERSGKRMWRNKTTGEVTFDDPLQTTAQEDMTVAQQKLAEAKAKRMKKSKSGKGR